jgi:Flp pilus assembly protein TadD
MMRTTTPIAALLLVCLTAPSRATASAGACPQGDGPLTRAIQLHQSGAIEEAIGAYKECLALCPDHPAARSNLGAAYAQAGRYDEAIGEYEKALEADRDNTAIRMNLAIALYKAERLSDAVRELKKVRSQRPKDVKALTLLADCHLRMGENAKVIELVAPFERENPQDLALAYLLGTALIHDGQYARGGVFIDRILRQEDTAEARVLMGEARQGVKDNVRAVEDFARAAELKPDLPRVHTLHGLALLEIDDRQAAEVAFRKALSYDPNDFEAHRQIGILSKLRGRYEEALTHLQDALRLRAGAFDVQYEIATLMITLGRSEEALSRLEGIVKAVPAYLEAHVSLATLYYRLGRRDDGDRERQIVNRLRAERRQREEERRRTSRQDASAAGAASGTDESSPR